MNFPQKFLIAADITTTSPLHISAVEKGTYNPDTGRIMRYSSKAGGVQCTLTRTMRLLGEATANMQQGADSENSVGRVRIPEVPVIPASTLGGRLRRKAADLIFQSLVQRGFSISTDAYNTMTSGTATTSLKGDETTPQVIAMARSDAFLANFGGTSFTLSAKSVIATGWPLLPNTQNLLMSEPLLDVQPFSDLNDMTSSLAVIRKNDVADLKGEHLEKLVGIEPLCNYMASESESRTESKKKKKDDDGTGKKSDLRTFNAFEAVSTGLSFGIRVAVTAHTPAQLGLMLLALQAMMREGQIGGKEARGLGQFVCDASRLYTVDPQTQQITTHSNIFLGKVNGYAFVEDALLDEVVAAGEDYVHTINPDLIEAFAATDAKAIKAAYDQGRRVAT